MNGRAECGRCDEARSSQKSPNAETDRLQKELDKHEKMVKDALPPEHCDPSSLGRIRFCTLLPTATAAPGCSSGPVAMRARSLSMLKAVTISGTVRPRAIEMGTIARSEKCLRTAS